LGKFWRALEWKIILYAYLEYVIGHLVYLMAMW
jgi:hypothetical protein